LIKKNGNLIIPGGDGDPRRQAAAAPYDPSGQMPSYPRPMVRGSGIINTGRGPIRRTGGATLGSSSSSTGGSAQSVAQSPLFYDYRWSTPDKFYFPRNRVVANSIWREIYKRDAAIAIATDMYAELPWSDFDISGIDDGSVKKLYEDMFSKLNLVPKFQQYTRDYLITGELILHTIFNKSKGIWDRVISHNPDYIRAEGVGLAIDQPLLWLRPTPEIRRLVNSADPRVRKLQKLLPREIVNSFRMNREIPLDSLNTTFLSRLNTGTDIRGTSLYTRLYRIVMYEDFIVNASLAVAQRNAAPLRLFKLGDPNTGWLPTEEDEAAFAEMLSMAEADPLAAIIMHHNVSCELVGVSDRVLLISKEWDFIERVKLLAMGVAKSFLIGETSLASALAGLQVLLERLSVLRVKFEHDWIIAKLCEPIAQMHEFYKRPQSELDHRIRIKKNDEMQLLVPTIKWRKSLESTQDVAILNVWRDLKDRGLLSDKTYASGAGLNIEAERRNQIEEQKYKKDNPEMYGIPQGQGAPGAPGGAGGGAVKPPPVTPRGLPPPAPKPPGASLKFNKYGSGNPYVNDDYYENLEDIMHDRSDADNRIYVDDVIEVVSDLNNELQENLNKAEQALPPGRSDLLSGAKT
jgi:hypothetical protein